jgi:uncharacterized protein
VHPRSTVGLAIGDFFRNGGRRAVVIRADGVSGRRTAARLVPRNRNGRGLYALDRYDAYVGLVCIPPVTRFGHLGPTVVARASAYCAERGAFLVADAPAGWRGTDSEVAAYRVPSRSSVAFYLPRMLTGRRITPPAGAVAGLYARTDAERGVWQAPAGRGAVLDVDGLAAELRRAELESLNAAGVNCLRTLQDTGVVVWGARTLAGSDDESSEWKYVSVRRLFLFLEESLDEGTRWTVFEPNDEQLWARVRSAVETFLVNLWRAGALPGEKPEDAFFVRCDRTTMTQDDIDNGRLIALVGFAPLRPAEFVVLRICQIAKAA